MRCIVYGDEDGQQSSPLRLVSRIIPTPKQGRSGHILVRVKVAGLNPVDAKDIMGDKLPANWRIAKRWLRWYIRNNIPGFDFAGTVVENFSGFAVDDKVFGTTPPFVGTLAEYISVPVDQVCHMPSNYTFEQAAALPLVG
jgi:NADPH:quinone reductase-like Zn-dependent oxidoreductase